MKWSKTDSGWTGERGDGVPAELLVAVLGGPQSPAGDLREVAADWAQSLPSGVFVIFEILTDIEARLAAALASLGLPTRRLILVGIGDGGTVCLKVAFEAAPIGIGVLVYNPQPDLPLAAAPVNPMAKVRLIGPTSGSSFHDELLGALVRRLRCLGIDARATELAEHGLTRSAIRLGAAYLAELSASALDPARTLPGPEAA